MAAKIEDYGLIGDCQTGALVSRDGSIDWLCLPRFDSGACFAALLGTPEHGRWLLQPKDNIRSMKRRYRDNSLILETDFETNQGEVTLIDFMPPRVEKPDLVRMIVGKTGKVTIRFELVIRFQYGSVIPWVRKRNKGLFAVAGPDGISLHSDVELHGEGFKTVTEFSVCEGESISFVLTWYPSNERAPRAVNPKDALESTESWWSEWSQTCNYQGEWREAVIRSLITLKALTYAPTGGMVAALTTSLPEQIGGERNWDYRYCWMRDATFTLSALLEAGYEEEAVAWREWMLRAVAGAPSQAQTLYGIDGQRWLPEHTLSWLPGYENSQPVRMGNAAAQQFQLDMFGELMDTLHLCRQKGIPPDDNAWQIQKTLIEHLEQIWEQPDQGIWELRSDRSQLTHSKVMAWVAFDRAIKGVENFGLSGSIERWRSARESIHKKICREGFNSQMNSFVQSYGSHELDASLLMIPLVGFLPAQDSRVVGTINAIQRHLMQDGFVLRYRSDGNIDGLEGGEGAFLLCSFWLVNNLAILGKTQEARDLFARLLNLRNDLGLLSEEYDGVACRFLGNYPQAFSHVALVNSAFYLSGVHDVAEFRAS